MDPFEGLRWSTVGKKKIFMFLFIFGFFFNIFCETHSEEMKTPEYTET